MDGHTMDLAIIGITTNKNNWHYNVYRPMALLAADCGSCDLAHQEGSHQVDKTAVTKGFEFGANASSYGIFLHGFMYTCLPCLELKENKFVLLSLGCAHTTRAVTRVEQQGSSPCVWLLCSHSKWHRLKTAAFGVLWFANYTNNLDEWNTPGIYERQ